MDSDDVGAFTSQICTSRDSKALVLLEQNSILVCFSLVFICKLNIYFFSDKKINLSTSTTSTQQIIFFMMHQACKRDAASFIHYRACQLGYLYSSVIIFFLNAG